MPPQSCPSDAELVGRCREGDHEAWTALVERFSRYIFAIIVQAFRLPGHDAEDVFQDVFTKAYENLEGLRDDAAVRPWLAQLTRNACIDRLRSGQRERPAGDDLDLPDADDTLERLDEALAVREALESLTGDCREVLDRFFVRDESYRTIAAELSIPPGTIASRISRCLERLRLELEGRTRDSDASRSSVTT